MSDVDAPVLAPLADRILAQAPDFEPSPDTTRVIVIAKVEHDQAWAVVRIWSADASGYVVPFRDWRRVCEALDEYSVFTLDGVRATFVFEDGRWHIEKLERP